jgi:hypothetical protein
MIREFSDLGSAPRATMVGLLVMRRVIGDGELIVGVLALMDRLHCRNQSKVEG